MHIICFKLVPLQIVFTDLAKHTALLHDRRTSLHAQCQQGPSKVSAWVSNAVHVRQCAQTCMQHQHQQFHQFEYFESMTGEQLQQTT